MSEKTKSCKWCGKPASPDSEECDGCWEMRHRIERDPKMARRMLAEMSCRQSKERLVKRDGAFCLRTPRGRGKIPTVGHFCFVSPTHCDDSEEFVVVPSLCIASIDDTLFARVAHLRRMLLKAPPENVLRLEWERAGWWVKESEYELSCVKVMIPPLVMKEGSCFDEHGERFVVVHQRWFKFGFSMGSNQVLSDSISFRDLRNMLESGHVGLSNLVRIKSLFY